MNSTRPPQFDFEYWFSLARDDPEQFEQERTRMIEELIDSAPGHMQQRIRGLQWQIDQVRRRAGNHTEACIRLNEMMLDAIYGDGGLLDSIEHPGRKLDRPLRGGARIIPLKKDPGGAD